MVTQNQIIESFPLRHPAILILTSNLSKLAEGSVFQAIQT